MADTKNYGLKGVGDDVQFGKAGGRFVFNTGASDFRATTDGTTLAHLQVLTPVANTDAATKLYVDDVAAGLDFKESSRCATTGATGTYNNTGGAAGNGQLTAVSAAIDGVTLAEGDRVLIKNHGTADGNGIYVVLATTTTLDRATDSDSDAEVTAGNFTFIEEGTVNADAGFVLQGPDPLTVGGAGGSNMNWVLFSTSSDIVAGVGLAKTGNVLDFDFSELTSASVIATSDELIFQDSGVESRITVTNFLADRDIVTITSNGIVTRTANDTYAARTITASSTATEEGLIVTNGDGVSDNPTIGLDIQGTTSAGGNAANTDELILFDGTNNKAYSITELSNAPAFSGSSTQIIVGDTSVTVSDTGTDGTITTLADGDTVIVTDDTGSTFTVDSATTNADIPVITVSATSSGTPTTGIGPSIQFQTETAAGGPGNQEIGGLIASEATSVTGAAEAFDFVFSTMVGGAAASERMRIASTGIVTAPVFSGDLTIDGSAFVTVDTAGQFTDDDVTLMTAAAVNDRIESFGYSTTVGVVTSIGEGTLTDIAGTAAVPIVNVDLSEATEAIYAPATDYLLFLDGGATGTAAKESGADFATALAGSGITATSGVLSADTSGTVTSSGTPLNNEVAVFTGGTDIDSDSTFTWNGATLAVTGVITVDELSFDGDTISNTVTDQPLILRPNGTGSIIFQNGSSEETLELLDIGSAVNGLSITPGQTGTVGPQIGIGSGGEANVDIGFVTEGTGVLSVAGGAGTYEDNVTADDDIPNKKYVDDAIETVGGSGTLDSITESISLATPGTITIGAATGIPANATIISTMVDITTLTDTAVTVTIGDATNGVASYMSATENDPEVQDIYVADGRVLNGASARQANAVVAGIDGTVGNATIIITFRHA